jgi:alkanesulfonate monooxygenase SsuD/methylene tetrahydromethanopterin reductase-like flavin-dependent oxidoreductase (luciferase family)
MRYGVYVPCYGAYADPCVLGDLAHMVEQAGWDGMFISDHLQWLAPDPQPVGDPIVLLAAIAASTKRIRIGALVTPIARRRPWKLARELLTLDHLSGGRVILGAGIGGDWIGEYSGFGEPADDRLHAEQLDEGLQILEGLWSGAPFSFDGTHYQIKETQFLPRPIQQPRIPIWVAGGWPRKRPAQRAARWDGIVPFGNNGPLTPADIRDLAAALRQERSDSAPCEIVCYATTIAEDGLVAPALIAQFAEAGATWWLHGLDMQLRQPIAELADRVRQGPSGPQDQA